MSPITTQTTPKTTTEKAAATTASALDSAPAPASAADPLAVHRLRLTRFVEGADRFDSDPLIAIFHRLIQRRALSWMLIDVADYRHVPGGPGVMLIGHQGDLALGSIDGAPGLSYTQKRPEGGGLAEHLERAGRRLAEAAARLAAEPALAGLTFGGRRSLRLLDRLRAPAGEATARVVVPVVREILEAAPGIDAAGGAEIDDADPRRPFGVEIAAPAA